MKIKEIFLGAILVATPLSYTNSVSASQNLLCDDCTTVQMRNMAISAGAGTRQVIDFRNGVTKKYEVLIENEFGFQMKTAAPLQPDANIAYHVAAASQALQEMEEAAEGPVLIPEHIAPSAYDLSGNSRLQNDTIDWLNANMPVEQHRDNFWGHVIAAIPISHPDLKLEITIRFSDDSTLDLQIKNDTANITNGYEFAWLFEVKRAKDSDNNSIPLTLDQFSGIAEFNGGESSSNAAGFQRAAANHGVVIRIPPGIPSGSGSGWVATIVCSKTNGETTCTKRYVKTQ